MDLLELLHKPQDILKISEFIREHRDCSFGEIIKKLETEGKLEWFYRCKPSELFSVKEFKTIKEEEVDDVDEYKEKILELLRITKLGESKRGLSTKEIILELGGTSSQCRRTLESLRSERKVNKTGKTQGMRWVLQEFFKEAKKNYLRSR